jgi:predicted anti-sigma-YlaC factor YlaD
MTNIQRHISMCSRHHARFKRMAEFARLESVRKMYEERAQFWLERQKELVNMWEADMRVSPRARA